MCECLGSAMYLRYAPGAEHTLMRLASSDCTTSRASHLFAPVELSPVLSAPT